MGKVRCRCSEIYLREGDLKQAKQYADEAYRMLKNAVKEDKSAGTADAYAQAIATVIRYNMDLEEFENCEIYFAELIICITADKHSREWSKDIIRYVNLYMLKGDYYAVQFKTEEAKKEYEGALKYITDAPPFVLNDELKNLQKELKEKITAL